MTTLTNRSDYAIANRMIAGLLSISMTAVTVCTTGCTSRLGTEKADRTGTTGAAVTTGSSFTGEQVFRGIFFGDGPVATLFPETWSGEAALQPSTPPAGLTGEALAERVQDVQNNVCLEGCSAETLLGLSDAIARLRSGQRDTFTENPSATLGRITSPVAESTINVLMATISQTDATFFLRFGAAMTSGNPVLVREGLKDGFRTITAASNLIDTAFRSGVEVPNLNPFDELDGPVLLVIVVAIAVVVVISEPGPVETQVQNDILVSQIATRLAAAPVAE